jgi:hypothetical protein
MNAPTKINKVSSPKKLLADPRTPVIWKLHAEFRASLVWKEDLSWIPLIVWLKKRLDKSTENRYELSASITKVLRIIVIARIPLKVNTIIAISSRRSMSVFESIGIYNESLLKSVAVDPIVFALEFPEIFNVTKPKITIPIRSKIGRND